MNRQQANKTINNESLSDKETIDTLRNVFLEHNYTLDPHGAVAYRALANHLHQHQDQKGILLGTAHPIKFPDVVKQALEIQLIPGASMEKWMDLEKKSIHISTDYQSLKKYLENFLKIF